MTVASAPDADVGRHPMPRLLDVDDITSSQARMRLLAERALQQDQGAWRELVDRLKGVAWKVLYGFGMSEEDRKDAFASTFFRLYEHLGSINEPEKLPGWIATTARNEAHTIFRRQRHTVGLDELTARDTPTIDPGDQLVAAELRAAMHAAFRRLSPDAQALMRLLTVDPPLGYDEISTILGMPRGSIGPLRQRCLERLRTSPEMAPYLNGGSRTS